MTHRRSPAPVALAAVVLRLALDLIDLALRLLVWLLTRLCLGLEWAVARLSPQSTSPVPQPRKAAQPVAPVRRTPAEPETERLDKLCRALGRNDPSTRALAATMLRNGTVVHP